MAYQGFNIKKAVIHYNNYSIKTACGKSLFIGKGIYFSVSKEEKEKVTCKRCLQVLNKKGGLNANTSKC